MPEFHAIALEKWGPNLDIIENNGPAFTTAQPSPGVFILSVNGFCLVTISIHRPGKFYLHFFKNFPVGSSWPML